MVLSENERAVLTVSVPAITAVTVAVLAALAAHLATKRERRRVLYSEAVRAAVAWRELLYRVRRRAPTQDRDLIERFHDLQEQLTYYEAWVGSESKYMSRSYSRLVKGAKERTQPMIKTAWAQATDAKPGGSETVEEHPDLSDLTESFLRDVRSHLSPWFWRKLAAAARNRKGA